MTLRVLAEEDLLEVLSWRNSPKVRNCMFSNEVILESEHFAWFRRIENDPTYKCFIYEDIDGRPQGVVNFSDLKPGKLSCFWGFYTAPEAPLGTGTSLGIAALDKAFQDLGLRKLKGEVLSTNLSSMKFHQKLGFEQEGLFRKEHLVGEALVDVIRFGILKEEWLLKRPQIIETLKKNN